MTFRQSVADRVSVLRLRGSLSDDPTARILQAVLIGVLAWMAVFLALVLPRFVARPAAAGALAALLGSTSAGALALLRRGSLRQSGALFLAGTCLTATILVYLNGGINSPALVLFASIPISAAWLLGHRVSLIFTCASLLCVLGMAVADFAGFPAPRYFPGAPLAIWAVFVLAVVIAVLPVRVAIRTLHESLAAAQRWIAELRATQEELARERDFVNRIVETSPVGIMALNHEGRITFLNSGGERAFGISREEAMQRRYNDPAWSPTSQDGSPYPDDEQPFRQVQQHHGVLKDVRMSIAKPDGRRALLSINAAPVLKPDGKFDGMVASIEDMTERARLDEELRKYRERLEDRVRQRTAELVAARDQALAANAAKSVFLANMSHELRTPLNAILGLSNLMCENPELSQDHLRTIRMIRRSGEHLLDLIDDVLDTAKNEAGAVTVTNVLTDLNDLVSGVVEMMRARAEERQLTLTVERQPGCPLFVHTDAAKVRQILINLVSNAIKFTHQGQVTVKIGAETREALFLKLEVQDTGVGIATDDQQRIFQSAAQVGTDPAYGTGLGLAITRQYVERMGGTIVVESSRGRGSRFLVLLPVAMADPPLAGPMGAGHEKVIGLAPGQPPYRVLIVEDQRESRIVLHQLLSGAGFLVQSAEDGGAAVMAFRSWQPHFIWMDWRLPAMSGERATKAIRALEGGRNVKIAAITTSVFSDERSSMLSAGVDEVVRKPFRPPEVFNCMARLLGVRYAYAKSAETAGGAPQLTPAALQALPESLREELAQAVMSLDVPRVAGAIRRASELDPELGGRLGQCAESLAFTAILRALRPAEPARRGAK